MSEWKKYGVCKCGLKMLAPAGSIFFIGYEVCPDCGIDKEKWILQTCKWTSTHKLLKPSTWGDGFWETK